jgi:hypothetical protein
MLGTNRTRLSFGIEAVEILFHRLTIPGMSRAENASK